MSEMSWISRLQIEKRLLPLSHLAAGGRWFVREPMRVVSLPLHGGPPLWIAETDTSPFGSSAFALVQGLLWVVSNHGTDAPLEILALDPASGEVVSRSAHDLRPTTRALAARGNLIALSGTEEDCKGKIVWIDAHRHEIVAETEVPSSNGVRAFGGHVLLASDHGLIAVEPGGALMTWWDQPTRGIDGRDDGLVFALQNGWQASGPPRVAAFEPTTGACVGDFDGSPVADASVEVVPLAQRGRCLVMGQEKGADLVDVIAGRLIAPIPFEVGWSPIRAVETPHGLVIVCQDATFETRLVLHAADDGRHLMDLDLNPKPRNVAHSGGTLLVCGKTTIFAVWGDRATATPPVMVPGVAPTVEAVASAPAPEAEEVIDDKLLLAVVDAFIACMKADPEGEEHVRLARVFNTLFRALLDERPQESVGTFALRIDALGIPYPVAFSDLIRVRGLGE